MEGDVITMQDIFIFERQGIGEGDKVLGQFKATGIRPKFADRLKAYGIDLARHAVLQPAASAAARERAAGGASDGRPAHRRPGSAALLIFLAVAFGTLSLALLVEYFQERSRRRDAMRQLRAFTDDGQGDGRPAPRAPTATSARWLQPHRGPRPGVRRTSSS